MQFHYGNLAHEPVRKKDVTDFANLYKTIRVAEDEIPLQLPS